MFLSLLNGGYLVVFTVAGGQTLGKMAAGIRVVGVEHVRVPVGFCRPANGRVCSLSPACRFGLSARVLRSGNGAHFTTISRGRAS